MLEIKPVSIWTCGGQTTSKQPSIPSLGPPSLSPAVTIAEQGHSLVTLYLHIQQCFLEWCYYVSTVLSEASGNKPATLQTEPRLQKCRTQREKVCGCVGIHAPSAALGQGSLNSMDSWVCDGDHPAKKANLHATFPCFFWDNYSTRRSEWPCVPLTSLDIRNRKSQRPLPISRTLSRSSTHWASSWLTSDRQAHTEVLKRRSLKTQRHICKTDIFVTWCMTD